MQGDLRTARVHGKQMERREIEDKWNASLCLDNN